MIDQLRPSLRSDANGLVMITITFYYNFLLAQNNQKFQKNKLKELFMNFHERIIRFENVNRVLRAFGLGRARGLITTSFVVHVQIVHYTISSFACVSHPCLILRLWLECGMQASLIIVDCETI